MQHTITPQGRKMAAKAEQFVREVIVPSERDERSTLHGPNPEMRGDMRSRARAAGVLTRHIVRKASHSVLVMSGTGLTRGTLGSLQRSPTPG